MTDVLVPLLDLADVRESLAAAREAVDAAFASRRRWDGPVAAEVALRSAWAGTRLEGHGYGLDELRSGTVTDPVAQGALRVTAALDGLAPLWARSPRQVLARLHVLAARGSVPDPDLGRPAHASPRLDALCALVVAPTETPVLLRAAIVHGELLTLNAFAGPNGLVARAAARLALIAGGLDPRALIAPELGHDAREPEYVGSSHAYATGTPDGVRAWLKHCAAAVTYAAQELTALGAA